MRILIILASGIGNAILFGPTLKEIKKKYPKSEIDLYSYKSSFADPFKESPLIHEIYYNNGIKTILKLRRNNYDLCITSFPSNRWQYNLFSFLTGARRRVTHSYKIGKISTLSFLQNKKIDSNENLHDVEQNLNLLKLLPWNVPKEKKTFFHITSENKRFSKTFIKNNHLKNKTLIGIHPGCGPLQFKKVGDKNFLDEIAKIKEKNKLVLIFGGPEEKKEKENMKKKIKNSLIIDSNLKNVAALIGECKYFITHDSGLMHISVAMRVPHVTAFFNGTNVTRTRPYDDKAKVLIFRENKLKYPFWSTKPGEE